MEPGIYIKDQHDGEEIRRAIRISTFRLDFGSPVSFLPQAAGTLAGDWNDWLDGRWNPCISKHLVEVYMKSRLLEVDEIVTLDAALSAFLDSDEAERSMAAAAALIAASDRARHHRVLEKFAVEMGKGKAAGHAATVFAIQAAEFHLPLFSTLISYLFFEWKSGVLHLTDGVIETSEERFCVDAMAALRDIAERLRTCLGSVKPAACA